MKTKSVKLTDSVDKDQVTEVKVDTEQYLCKSIQYDDELFKYLNGLSNTDKSYKIYDLDVLGGGVTGNTYTASVKDHTTSVVLKEMNRSKDSSNEYEALLWLQKKMLTGEIPPYYVFLYTSFTSGKKKYFVLDKADTNLDDYLIENNLSKEEYLSLFWAIADAVEHLEKNQMNHGDLWGENIMLKDGKIVIIDFDAAYKNNSTICSPALGGSDDYRSKFILGYDMNRFFDSCIFSYESYIKKKTDYKKAKILKAKRQLKKGKKVVIPKMEEEDEDDREFDDVNIIYPPEIIAFMYSLKRQDVNSFDDNEAMSGASIKKLIEQFSIKK
jgi:tRNA A-37 threonylcarbamoyl transferase component Bud32